MQGWCQRRRLQEACPAADRPVAMQGVCRRPVAWVGLQGLCQVGGVARCVPLGGRSAARRLACKGRAGAPYRREIFLSLSAMLWYHCEKRCRMKKAIESLTKQYQKRVQAGVCGGCGNNPPRPGKVACQPCQDKYLEREAQNRLKVIEAYGGKCAHCPEARSPCLQLHHRNFDGKGSNSANWRWARLNSYPDTLELICRNCHVVIHVEAGCERPPSTEVRP